MYTHIHTPACAYTHIQTRTSSIPCCWQVGPIQCNILISKVTFITTDVALSWRRINYLQYNLTTYYQIRHLQGKYWISSFVQSEYLIPVGHYLIV